MLRTFHLLLRWSSGLLAAMALFTILWLTLFNLAGSHLLGQALPGQREMTAVLTVVVVFGALPLVAWRGEHVNTPTPRLPVALQDAGARLGDLVSTLVFASLAWSLAQRALRFAELGGATAYLRFSIALVAGLMAGLLLLTALAHLLRVWAPLPASGDPGT